MIWFVWWGDTLWSPEIFRASKNVRALQSIAPPRFMETTALEGLSY